MLGLANNRMKDFFDLWVMARDFEFERAVLCRAIRATFDRRKTALPAETPVALSPEFADDPVKARQWQAFLQKSRLAATEVRLGDVLGVPHVFFLPPTSALRQGAPITMFWTAGGPWDERWRGAAAPGIEKMEWGWGSGGRESAACGRGLKPDTLDSIS